MPLLSLTYRTNCMSSLGDPCGAPSTYATLNDKTTTLNSILTIFICFCCYLVKADLYKIVTAHFIIRRYERHGITNTSDANTMVISSFYIMLPAENPISSKVKICCARGLHWAISYRLVAYCSVACDIWERKKKRIFSLVQKKTGRRDMYGRDDASSVMVHAVTHAG